MSFSKFAIFGIFAACARLAGVPGFGMEGRLPEGVKACLVHAGYPADDRLRPRFLRGDFFGGGKVAFAVLVVNRGARGVLVCGDSGTRWELLGAVRPFHGMVSLDFDSWRMYPRGKIEQGVGEGPPPILRGDAIWLDWSERASAIIYWDGHEFAWYQQGD